MNNKKCVLCLKVINQKKDNWNKLETYTRQFLDSAFYFHDVCYSDYIKNRTNPQNSPQIQELLSRVHGLMDNMGVDRVVRVGI